MILKFCSPVTATPPSLSILVARCEYFRSALSWPARSEFHVDKGTNEPSAQRVADMELNPSQNGQKERCEQTVPTLTFEEGPQAVHDMLTHMHNPDDLFLRPDTVEPLLGLASMIGYEALVERCESFLQGKLVWDPIGMLKLAEDYGLRNLYPVAANAVMRNYERNERERTLRLSQKTIDKVRTYCASAQLWSRPTANY